MALRITPMRPIERGGLKGFGLSVFIDNSPETATRRLDDLGSVQDGLKMSSDGQDAGVLTRPDGERLPVSGVTAGETAPHSHSLARSSQQANNAGGVISSRPVSTLIQFAGDDRPARAKGVNYDPSTMFRQGKDTHEIAEAKGMTEAAVLKRVTLERCRRLRLPNPYGAEA